LSMHFVLSCVYSPNRLPIPAAKIIACIVCDFQLYNKFSALLLYLGTGDPPKSSGGKDTTFFYSTVTVPFFVNLFPNAFE
jgi:hypothetical protein